MINPILNQILVRPFFINGISNGGIVVPDSCRKESDKVEVLAVGGGTLKTPMQFKKGDILFRTHDWGTPVEYNGEMFYLMEQNSILAIAV